MVNVTGNTDPVPGLRFTVDFTVPVLAAAGPSSPLQFSRVSGLEHTSATIEYREGNDPFTVRKYPGLTEFPVVTLEKGVSKDNSLIIWRNTVSSFADSIAGIAPNSIGLEPTGVAADILGQVTILLYDAAGSVVKGWQLLDAWPKAVKYGDLDATSNEILIESVEIEHQGLVILGTGGQEII